MSCSICVYACVRCTSYACVRVRVWVSMCWCDWGITDQMLLITYAYLVSQINHIIIIIVIIHCYSNDTVSTIMIMIVLLFMIMIELTTMCSFWNVYTLLWRVCMIDVIITSILLWVYLDCLMMISIIYTQLMLLHAFYHTHIKERNFYSFLLGYHFGRYGVQTYESVTYVRRIVSHFNFIWWHEWYDKNQIVIISRLERVINILNGTNCLE